MGSWLIGLSTGLLSRAGNREVGSIPTLPSTALGK